MGAFKAMKEIEVTIGWKVLDDNDNVIGYIPDQSENGFCYKDISAYENNEGIIYIAECEFINSQDMLTIEDANECCSWTKNQWLSYVREVMDDDDICATLDKETYEKVADYIALNVLNICDWQDLSTYIEEWDFEDCIQDIVGFVTIEFSQKDVIQLAKNWKGYINDLYVKLNGFNPVYDNDYMSFFVSCKGNKVVRISYYNGKISVTI